MEGQEEQQKEQSPDKLKKTFESKLKQLSDFLGRDKHLLPTTRVDQDEFSKIVGELLKEEREKNSAEIKQKLSALLKGYADLKREVSNKRKELEKLEADKMKEFNKAAEDLFSRITVLKSKETDLTEGLKSATEEK